MSGSNFPTSKYPTVKTVNGKPVGDDCVTCGAHMERGRWLCSKCSIAIGSENITNTVANMPEYLHDSQYEKWLKIKLLEYMA
jgi:hypothetical protein